MKRLQRGAIVIEVLVSSLIGTLMLYGALSIMLNGRTSYLAREGLAGVEERGRLALDILAEDIRLSGYKGCAASEDKPLVHTVDLAHSWMQPELGIRGWQYEETEMDKELDLYTLGNSYLGNNDWVPDEDKGLTNSVSVLKGSDVLELWISQPFIIDITDVKTDGAVTSLDVVSSSLNGLPDCTNCSDGDQRLFIVSDCERSLLVKADSIKHETDELFLDAVNTNTNSEQLYTMVNPQAVSLQQRFYYLAIGADRERPSLYRKDIYANGDAEDAVEIMPGILNLQFQYGVNLDSELSADMYTDAHGVSDWNDVVSVRIYMLVETESEKAVPEGQSYHFFSQTYEPENEQDKRVRREYSATVALRNRMIGLTSSSGGKHAEKETEITKRSSLSRFNGTFAAFDIAG